MPQGCSLEGVQRAVGCEGTARRDPQPLDPGGEPQETGPAEASIERAGRGGGREGVSGRRPWSAGSNAPRKPHDRGPEGIHETGGPGRGEFGGLSGQEKGGS